MSRWLPLTSSLLLREIRDEIRGLRSDLQAGNAPQFDAAAVHLVREIHAYVGSLARFSASELLEQGDDELREALAGMGANALGRLEGRNVDGLRVMRHGPGVHGWEW